MPQTEKWVTRQKPGGRARSFAQRTQSPRQITAGCSTANVHDPVSTCLVQSSQPQTSFPLHITNNLRTKTRSGTRKERCKLRGKRRECIPLSPLCLQCHAPGMPSGSMWLQEAPAQPSAWQSGVCKQASTQLLVQMQPL